MIFIVLLLNCTSDGEKPTPIDSEDSSHEHVEETPRGDLLFRIPLADKSKFTILVGVDHDPVEQQEGIDQTICTDYQGRQFPHCYDQHRGNDYMLQGGFATMDDGSAEIVAAADGVVIKTEDGNYDRCHSDIASFDIDCDGYPMKANYVILEHETGHQTMYSGQVRWNQKYLYSKIRNALIFL